MEEIVQIISNLGFPIACVVVMFWMQNKEREAHQAESKEWVDAINRNTVVMEKILTQMGVDAE
mgnify:CR=1 FL=1